MIKPGVGGHVCLGPLRQVEGGVGVDGFKDFAILIDDGRVPIDRCLGWTFTFAAVPAKRLNIWMRPSSIGAAQLMMMWRMPLG
jgi:hypothetical protein